MPDIAQSLCTISVGRRIRGKCFLLGLAGGGAARLGGG